VPDPVPQPELRTERLVLRALTREDAPAVQRLCAAREIAENTLLIPHPYPEGMAAEWISKVGERLHSYVFGIALRDSGSVVGVIGIDVARDHDRAEIGYWIGVPFWNHGYVTEAARAVVGWGFRELALHRIVAEHFTRNPSSGRVMQKLGMTHEGSLRKHIKKWGEYVDVEVYGILAADWRGDALP
jgi:ribosomal-protein-alanine N-acetyltransferase